MGFLRSPALFANPYDFYVGSIRIKYVVKHLESPLCILFLIGPNFYPKPVMSNPPSVSGILSKLALNPYKSMAFTWALEMFVIP